MSENKQDKTADIYAETIHYDVNPGDETIHAKRMTGRFRSYKWYASSLYILFFITPYFRWEGGQAILFDIPHRQFHFWSLTIWPQDIWMLSLILILLAISLFAATAIAGRVWCGYFCFQTIWTDWFTWIEDKIEGSPMQRRRLDADVWTFHKVKLKTFKHSLWLLISILTGVTFTAYFIDIYALWQSYLNLSAGLVSWVSLAVIFIFTYIFSGFMREQVCFWLCPYARIQSVMVDKDTEMPTYDVSRGEPRGKLHAENSDKHGDCIDCHLCVGVCPTGVDIRNGMSEGCITCGMCIDACDGIMDKIQRPRGLIRYASRKEMDGNPLPVLFKRPRVVAYSIILLLASIGIIYGLTHIPPLELSIVHERQPLFIQMSDGSIKNKYTIKAINKTTKDLHMHVSVMSTANIRIFKRENADILLKSGKIIPLPIFLIARPETLKEKQTPVRFILESIEKPSIRVEYESVFIKAR